MLSKRQFIRLYDQAVLGIRQIKNNNDKVNKSIGAISQSALYRQVQSDKHQIQALMNKVNELLSKMENNYLDPETARKIGIVKQQLRIQTDRRTQLSENVNEITRQIHNKKQTFQNQDLPLFKTKKSLTPTHYIQMQINNNCNRQSIMINTSSSTSATSYQPHYTHHDHEIEIKLIYERSEDLGQAHERMNNIKNITNQTSQLVNEQGDKIDIITDDLFMTYKDIKYGNDQVEKAIRLQRKARKKLLVLCFVLIIIIGTSLFFLLL